MEVQYVEDKNKKRYNKPKMPRSPGFWVMVVLLGLMLVMTIVTMNSAVSGNVETVDYSAFLRMLESHQIEYAQIGENVITFTLKEDSALPSWFFGGAAKRYQTLPVEDPYLVERLQNAGVTFGAADESGLSLIHI